MTPTLGVPLEQSVKLSWALQDFRATGRTQNMERPRQGTAGAGGGPQELGWRNRLGQRLPLVEAGGHLGNPGQRAEHKIRRKQRLTCASGNHQAPVQA